MIGLGLEPTGKNKEGTFKTDLEREFRKRTKQHKYELGRRQGQKKMEDCCGSPMLPKEPRGLIKSSHISLIYFEPVPDMCLDMFCNQY